MDGYERAGNAHERVAKRKRRRDLRNRRRIVELPEAGHEMSGRNPEHGKPPLYWLTLIVIFASFIAVVLT